MKKSFFIRSLVALSFALLSCNATAATLGTDNGGNYGGTWISSSNFGTGFGDWNLWTTGTDDNNFAGHFISSGQFGMYANGSTSSRTSQANAQRLFDGGALTAGQSFLIELGVDFRNGFKGIDLFSGTFQNVWNFNVGGDTYSPGGAALPEPVAPYVANSVFSIRANQLTSSTFEVLVSRGGSNLYTSSVIDGTVNGFKLYIGGTEVGDANNLLANNLQIIPEPSSSLLMGLGLAGLFALRRVRKNG
ncbi:MAG: PEP-CTERM sorting domain-containing protein [Verrucomicrobia bacterium]|nr:PEP-CTERM sorting domain-containing protein [Verrucomicrobiota bacterium]